jgi:hypothetical protein
MKTSFFYKKLGIEKERNVLTKNLKVLKNKFSQVLVGYYANSNTPRVANKPHSEQLIQLAEELKLAYPSFSSSLVSLFLFLNCVTFFLSYAYSLHLAILSFSFPFNTPAN